MSGAHACIRRQGGGLLVVALALLGCVSLAAYAGPLDSSTAPGATQSYTLEDLYQRLNAGTAGAQSVFAELGAGPTLGTMHTINDIMGKAPSVDDTDGATVAQVLSGKTFWGLRSGAWGCSRARCPRRRCQLATRRYPLVIMRVQIWRRSIPTWPPATSKRA